MVKFFCLLFIRVAWVAHRPAAASRRAASPGFGTARRRRETRPVDEASTTVRLVSLAVNLSQAAFALRLPSQSAVCQTSADGTARGFARLATRSFHPFTPAARCDADAAAPAATGNRLTGSSWYCSGADRRSAWPTPPVINR